MRRYPTPKKWYPKNPEKYVGDVDNIIVRSQLEGRYFKYFDENPSILNYSSEELIIKYYYKVDKKIHRYFPDFVIKIRNRKGEISTMVIEIKSSSETRKPIRGKKRHQTFLNEVLTWEKNQAKWAAAEAFCKKNNMTFKVFTENEIKFSWGKDKT